MTNFRQTLGQLGRIVLAIYLTAAVTQLSNGQSEGAIVGNQDEQPGMLNLKIPTLGGKQFWTDFAWRRGWRVQQNALTGHWRLLDPKNFRHAWGSEEACRQALDKAEPDRSLPHSHTVILMHGLIRSADSMGALGKALTKEMQANIFSFEYASTRSGIAEHAKALRRVIDGLPRESKLSFVGHSMGNIVVRHAIGDWLAENDQATLNRMHSVVMVGPPNQGASIARQLAKTGLFEFTAGEGAMELGPKWTELEKRLATPTCAFGIIAGQLTNSVITNPLVNGEGDFVVSLEETQLAGAKETLTVPQIHSFLMDDPKVQTAVRNFLERHTFD